jgi:hypothetical protein
VAHVFHHPVTEPAWYLDFDHAPRWPDDSPELVEFITETFEHSSEVLAGISDDELNQGFWFLLSVNGYAGAITDAGIPMEARHRALQSMTRLFEELMVERCSGRLADLVEAGAKPLDSACYMWFDIIGWWIYDPTISAPDDLDDYDSSWRDLDEHAFRAEVFEVLRAILAIQHDSCRESALHGLNHFRKWDPETAASIIDEFLAATPDLRPELVTYAREAREGRTQ